MPELKREEIARYLGELFGREVKLLGMKVLGEEEREDVKGYGYGVPVKLELEMGGRQYRMVLHTIAPAPFGHERMADRARELLWEHQAFNQLPAHVRSLDVSGFLPGGRMISLGKVEEFCLLTDYLEGESYSHDLERIRDEGSLGELDLARADALCDYLVEIHQRRGENPELYVRRIRELVGDGECIMGIADSYPPHPLVPPSLLEKIEHLCVGWRWRIKSLRHRLRQVHGDFHPWNILFRSGTDFSLLDRSRGEYGDPADDVTSLTLNYVFFSLQRSGRLEGGFEEMFLRFWDRYLEKARDRELLQVAPPFIAFRGLVMASPLWYPSLSDQVRKKLLTLIVAVLEDSAFDPRKVNEYCGT
jgi:hypothetical protein